MSNHRTQTDITLTGGEFLSLPKFLPGRLNTQDFVFFNWPRGIKPSDYTVVVSTNDVAGPIHRRIATLAGQVELPFVHFDAYSTIGVIPTHNPNKSQFWSRLNRGSTYNIPDVSDDGKQYNMIRHGVLTAAVGTDTFLS